VSGNRKVGRVGNIAQSPQNSKECKRENIKGVPCGLCGSAGDKKEKHLAQRRRGTEEKRKEIGVLSGHCGSAGAEKIPLP